MTDKPLTPEEIAEMKCEKCGTYEHVVEDHRCAACQFRYELIEYATIEGWDENLMVQLVIDKACEGASSLIAALREATAERDHYAEREEHFAAVLKVADGGRYRNDWNASIDAVVAERDAAIQRDQESQAWMEEAMQAIRGLVAGDMTGHPVVDVVAGLLQRATAAESTHALLLARAEDAETKLTAAEEGLRQHTAYISELVGSLKAAEEERDRLRKLAYPDGPAEDAAMPCSAYMKLEATISRQQETIKGMLAELEILRAAGKVVADSNDAMIAALEEIAEGVGPFSRDPLTHASNCIDAMKALARAALAASQPKEPEEGK